MTSVAIKRIPITDFQELTDNVVPDAKSKIVQLGHGPMCGVISHVDLSPTLSVTTGSFNRAIRAIGPLSETRWTGGILMAADGPATGHGHELRVGDLFIAAPNVERRFTFQDNTTYAVAQIATEPIEEFLAGYPGVFDTMREHPLTVLRATPRAAEANTKIWKSILETLLRERDVISDEAIADLQRRMINIMTEPFIDEATANYKIVHLPPPDDLTQKVVDFLHQRKEQISLKDLALLFNVNQRKLERGFEKYVGMPPAGYHTEVRLCAAYTQLRQGKPGGVTVRKVAADVDFNNHGRFSKQFSEKFGESPLTLLKRRLPSVVVICLGLSLKVAHLQTIPSSYFYVRPVAPRTRTVVLTRSKDHLHWRLVRHHHKHHRERP